jgi:hypothetical protein
LGGGQVFTELRDGGGSAPGHQGIQSHRQRAVAGVDVAAAGEGLTDQGVCFVVGAGVTGMNTDRAGQGCGGVERGDADGVGDGFSDSGI